MERKLKTRIAALGTILFVMFSSITSYAAENSIGVTLVRQAKSNWCWAVSLEMSATYLGYSTYDQRDIVKDVKGTSSNPYPNEPGSASDYKNGMNFATGGDYSATRSSGTISITSLNTYMTDHVPVIIAIGAYNSSGSRTSGHAVVVYSVDKDNKRFKVKNPASDYDTTYDYSTITSSSAKSRWDATIKIS